MKHAIVQFFKLFEYIKVSILTTVVFTILVCGIYPLIIYGIGQLLFREKAEGSLIFDKNGKVVIGSKLIGQNFQEAKYFHPRPSAAGKRGYDATHSSGSNLGPTSQKLIDTVKVLAQEYRIENQIEPKTFLPVDAVTASGSGLDPHISVENALLQVPRIAKARAFPEAVVKSLVQESIENPSFGILGKARVNVLLLNLKLDELNL